MKVLFQIGKELGALEARLSAMENAKCSCKSKSRGAKDRDLPKEQLATIRAIRGKHAEIFAGLNKVLRDLQLSQNLVIGRFTLMDKDDLVGIDDEDQCCMCCLNGSGGYEYCCDYAGCSCCD